MEERLAEEPERGRESDVVDWAAAVHAASRPRMLPTFSRDGIGGPKGGENAGRPCPSPSRLLLGPATATFAYELLLGTSGGGIDALFLACDGNDAVVEFVKPPFLGGSTGGSDVDAEKFASSSFGAGLLVFDRRAAVPLARRNQEGLDFVEGFEGRSEEEAALSKDD